MAGHARVLLREVVPSDPIFIIKFLKESIFFSELLRQIRCLISALVSTIFGKIFLGFNMNWVIRSISIGVNPLFAEFYFSCIEPLAVVSVLIDEVINDMVVAEVE